MTWGFFSVAHIISLIIGVLMVVGLYYTLRKRSDKLKTAVLFVLSLSGICAIIYNLVSWGTPIEYLPLHLCSINALVLPIAVLTRNKVLNNLLLLWSIGALLALVLNTSVSETIIFGPVFCFYYFPHVFEFGVPILMFTFGLTKKDIKCIGSTVGITAAAYTVIHFINLHINSYTEKHNILDANSEVIKVNYMYSLYPENPLLDLFYKMIPYSYWYMYAVFIIVFVYLGLIYLPDIIRAVKRKTR